MFGKTHSDETKGKISAAHKGRSRPEGAGIPSHKIVVFDYEANQTTTYDSISSSARALNIYRTSIHKYIDTGKLLKKRYLFTGEKVAAA